MFVETYRTDTLPGGEARTMYPQISDEDWKAWQAFLPVRTNDFPEQTVDMFWVRGHSEIRLYNVFNVPLEAGQQIVEAVRTGNFQRVEVWGKENLHKDPIAVGVRQSDGHIFRYLIARWGPDALVPFETIKRRAWLYRLQNNIEPALGVAAMLGLCWLSLQAYIHIFGW